MNELKGTSEHARRASKLSACYAPRTFGPSHHTENALRFDCLGLFSATHSTVQVPLLISKYKGKAEHQATRGAATVLGDHPARQCQASVVTWLAPGWQACEVCPQRGRGCQQGPAQVCAAWAGHGWDRACMALPHTAHRCCRLGRGCKAGKAEGYQEADKELMH